MSPFTVDRVNNVPSGKLNHSSSLTCCFLALPPSCFQWLEWKTEQKVSYCLNFFPPHDLCCIHSPINNVWAAAFISPKSPGTINILCLLETFFFFFMFCIHHPGEYAQHVFPLWKHFSYYSRAGLLNVFKKYTFLLLFYAFLFRFQTWIKLFLGTFSCHSSRMFSYYLKKYIMMEYSSYIHNEIGCIPQAQSVIGRLICFP